MSPKVGSDGYFDEYVYIQLTKDVRMTNPENEGGPELRGVYLLRKDAFGAEYYEWMRGMDKLHSSDIDAVADAMQVLGQLVPRTAWVSYREVAPVVEFEVKP